MLGEVIGILVGGVKEPAVFFLLRLLTIGSEALDSKAGEEVDSSADDDSVLSATEQQNYLYLIIPLAAALKLISSAV